MSTSNSEHIGVDDRLDLADEYTQYVQKRFLDEGLKDRADATSVDEIAPLVTRLTSYYRRLKEEQDKQTIPYIPQGEWAAYTELRKEYYDKWSISDIEGSAIDLLDFWRNDLAIVQEYAHYHQLRDDVVLRAKFMDRLGYSWMVWKNLTGGNPSELRIPNVGNPWGYMIDDVLIAPKALRYNVMARQIREITSDIDRPVVAEIGAGYGGMALFLLRDDRPMTYVTFDLPEVQILSAYYLSRTLQGKKIFFWGEEQVSLEESIAEYDLVFMPNWKLPELPDASVDLFFNAFSLSEMHPDTIAEYIAQIERSLRGYFLHNNMDRSGVVQHGSERVPSSQFPIRPEKLKRLFRRYDLFQRRHVGRDGDYREELYQRARP